MTKQPNIPDDEIDRLLAGHAPEDSRLDGVAQFLADVNAAYTEDSASTLESKHVTAMVAAAQSLAEQAETAELDPQLGQNSRRAGPFSLANLAAHKWATAAAVAVMGLLAFGGAAYAGVLPAPIQEVTSSCASHVGVAIPRAQARDHSGVKEASATPNARRTGKTSDSAKRVTVASHGAGGIGSVATGTGASSKAKIGVVSGSAVPTPTAGSSVATGGAIAARAKSAHAKVQAKAKAHARAKASAKATKKVRKKSRVKARKRTKVRKRRTRRRVERGESDRSVESTSESESRRERRTSSRG